VCKEMLNEMELLTGTDMKYELAKEMIAKMLQYAQEMNGFLLVIKEECDAAEFRRYQVGIGEMLGRMYIDIMRPIYKDFPSLEPPGFKDE